MTVAELITELQRAEHKLGGDTPVFDAWSGRPIDFMTYTSRSLSHDGVERVFIHARPRYDSR